MQEPKFHLQPIRLCGTIANLQRSRRTHDFVLTQFQQSALGVTAVGAAAMGLGAAIELVNVASNADEEADYFQNLWLAGRWKTSTFARLHASTAEPTPLRITAAITSFTGKSIVEHAMDTNKVWQCFTVEKETTP